MRLHCYGRDFAGLRVHSGQRQPKSMLFDLLLGLRTPVGIGLLALQRGHNVSTGA